LSTRSSFTQSGSGNAATLVQKWDLGLQAAIGTSNNGVTGTPAVGFGNVYFGSWNGFIVAAKQSVSRFMGWVRTYGINFCLFKSNDVLLRQLASRIHDACMTVQCSAANLLSRHDNVAAVPLQHSDGGLIDVSKNFIHHTTGHDCDAELLLSLRWENGAQGNVVLPVPDVWQ
jgi:hypothetical protein